MEYLEMASNLPFEQILLLIWMLILILGIIAFYLIARSKAYQNKPVILTCILAGGEFLCVFLIGAAGIKDALDLLVQILIEIVPSWKEFTIDKFIILSIVSVALEWGAMDLFFYKIQSEIEKIDKNLRKTTNYKKQVDKFVIPDDYYNVANKQIYIYFASSQKMKTEYDKIGKSIAEEQVNAWHNNIKGKETTTILAKVLILSNGNDGTIIKLQDNGEKCLLFMTGDAFDDDNARHLQSNANKRATQRFENMKARGFLEGDIDHFYITLQGKEYVLEKNALALLPPKLDSNEQSNNIHNQFK